MCWRYDASGSSSVSPGPGDTETATYARRWFSKNVDIRGLNPMA